MSVLLARRRAMLGSFDPLSDITWHSVFSADEITGLADGDPVSTWADSSGNGRDLTQATAASRPVFRAAAASLNGQPAVEFDGVDDYLDQVAYAADITGVSEMVVLVRLGSTGVGYEVFNGTTGTKRRALSVLADGRWQIYQGGGAGVPEGTGSADTSPHLLDPVFDATDTLTIDGTMVASGNAGSEALGAVRAGNNAGLTRALFGHIAFLAIKDGLLTAHERSELLAWSRAKYGTP